MSKAPPRGKRLSTDSTQWFTGSRKSPPNARSHSNPSRNRARNGEISVAVNISYVYYSHVTFPSMKKYPSPSPACLSQKNMLENIALLHLNIIVRKCKVDKLQPCESVKSEKCNQCNDFKSEKCSFVCDKESVEENTTFHPPSSLHIGSGRTKPKFLPHFKYKPQRFACLF